jgi:hypothetical protein
MTKSEILFFKAYSFARSSVLKVLGLFSFLRVAVRVGILLLVYVDPIVNNENWPDVYKSFVNQSK